MKVDQIIVGRQLGRALQRGLRDAQTVQTYGAKRRQLEGFRIRGRHDGRSLSRLKSFGVALLLKQNPGLQIQPAGGVASRGLLLIQACTGLGQSAGRDEFLNRLGPGLWIDLRRERRSKYKDPT